MNHRLYPLAMFTLAIAFAVPAVAQDGRSSSSAQEPASSKTLGTVVNGNTTIEFKAADTRNLDMPKLKTWDEFAVAHPKIATALARKPARITDPGYAAAHPELANFYSAHPDIREAMAENPGNFVAIPPRPGE